MANSQMTRFVTEVAPPQFISVMRRQAPKMLDTIIEEEIDAGVSESLPSSLKGSSCSFYDSNLFSKEFQKSFNF